ncbi:MAG: hypothetical protein F7C38_03275 [Desulfurococcales archaeon]|nr:hypothetical protein [Desulfurococcales archaeon]
MLLTVASIIGIIGTVTGIIFYLREHEIRREIELQLKEKQRLRDMSKMLGDLIERLESILYSIYNYNSKNININEDLMSVVDDILKCAFDTKKTIIRIANEIEVISETVDETKNEKRFRKFRVDTAEEAITYFKADLTLLLSSSVECDYGYTLPYPTEYIVEQIRRIYKKSSIMLSEFGDLLSLFGASELFEELLMRLIDVMYNIARKMIEGFNVQLDTVENSKELAYLVLKESINYKQNEENFERLKSLLEQLKDLRVKITQASF